MVWPEAGGRTAASLALGRDGGVLRQPTASEREFRGDRDPVLPATPQDPWDQLGRPGHTHDPHEVTVRLDDAGAPDSDRPVFVDESGRRRNRYRRLGIFVGGACATYAAVIVVTLLSGNSDAPWLPVPGQKDDKPAGKVDTPPPPDESAGSSGGGGVFPGLDIGAGASVGPGGVTLSPGGGAKPSGKPSASASAPGASAGPKPSVSASAKPGPSGSAQNPGPSPSASTPPGGDPSPSGSPSPGPSDSGGSDPAPGPDTVADGPAAPAPVEPVAAETASPSPNAPDPEPNPETAA
ncbi:hypothetical protein SGFS_049040 [Streptomyces graminofaciens]|uniref:Translation initiation factor IF-2 n=1 Tax=Streptomyces graminofaciens TaxID=68212 RepID=A0ABM8HKY3_9ACTN|nr:hypothetical protein [Streptomyces graminofaciens]BBC33610.1 hypothetical protein SGFS_049040 [Streptomyces graminofaciens]